MTTIKVEIPETLNTWLKNPSTQHRTSKSMRVREVMERSGIEVFLPGFARFHGLR
jgi:hypothetical protein